MQSTPATSTTELSQPRPAVEPEPKRKKSVWVRVILYTLLVAIVAFAVYKVWQNQQAKKAQTDKQAAALLNRPVPVQAVPVAKRVMPVYLTALGTVTPYYSVTVKARVNGQLDKVNFTEGQEVKAGQTIMVIDPKPYKAALDQAKGTLAHDEAALKNAQAEASRYKALYDAGVVSKESFDAQNSTFGQYEGQIESDKAAIETAQLQLDWCSIQSPISGRIGLRLVDPGNIITANTTNLVIVNQFKPIAVYFTLPQNQLPEVLAKLRGSQKLVADAFDRGDTIKLTSGQLLTADNQIDTTTGTDKLKAVFANGDEKLFPNQFVNIHLVMEDRKSALVVPSAAIQTGSQGTFVWVVQQDGTVKMAPVKVAIAEGQSSIIDSGVVEGEPVVIDGADRLRTGAKVIVSAPRKRSGDPTQQDLSQGELQGTPAGKAPGSSTGTSTDPAPDLSAPPPPMTAGQEQTTHRKQHGKTGNSADPRKRQNP